ncbi:MAG: hypothetical protein WCQ48_07170 [Chloroflexota bacterium]|nr:MAG: hypothetical protein DWI58_04325 [Chloroflexota bacterium]
MGTVFRWASLIALAVFAYLLLTQSNYPRRPGQGRLGAAFARMREIGRKVQLVLLIYVLTIMISAVLQLYGWKF